MDPYQPYRAKKAQTRPDLGRDLDRFEANLQRLRVEFEKFFNGALALPPDELRQQLSDELRRLRGISQLSSVDQFRLNGAEARFNSYHELFNRRLRDLEEGRAAAPVAVPEIRKHDPRRGVEIGERADAEAVESLFAGLAAGPTPPKFDLDTFGRYLEKQAATIRQKTGCKTVRFRLEDDAGKIRLKAKPVQGE